MNSLLKRLCIISGASPNTNDAVGDFAWFLAKELSNYFNISFIVPEIANEKVNVTTDNIEIYYVGKTWGIDTSKQIQSLVEEKQPDVLLVHFVPQLYGWLGAKPYFALLLRTLKQKDIPIVTIAHEFSSPYSTSPKQILLSAAHRILFRTIIKASKSVVFTNVLYLELVRKIYKNRGKDFHCIPVGCPAPILHLDESSKQDIRQKLGIKKGELLVSTFGSSISSVVNQLKQLFVGLVSEIDSVRFLLIGKSSERLREELATNPALENRVLVTGSLTGEEISSFLSISDLYVVFYPDGASTRRTSFMLGLAHALPMVSNKGVFTDSLVESSQAIHLINAKLRDIDLTKIRDLLVNAQQKEALSNRAGRFFAENFAWDVIGKRYKRVVESCMND